MNTQPEHTPGPWTISGDPCVPNRILIEVRRDGRKSFIADLGLTLGHGGSPEANARLIAAAPDLLKALLAMLDSFAPYAQNTVDDEGEDALHSSVILARAAISKATGTKL